MSTDERVSARDEDGTEPGEATAAELAPTETLGEYFSHWWAGVKAGDLGTLPIIVGLVLIVAIFGTLESIFFQPVNFVNILLQMSVVATLAIGTVFVLLLAEIDLAVSFVAATGAVICALLLRPGDPGWPWWAAILAVLAVTTLIGLLHALVITKAGVPSFVVTLAGFLVWSGVVLILTTQFSTAGTITIQDDVVVGIANSFLPDVWGWLLGLAVVGGYAALQWHQRRVRRRGGLPTKPLSALALQLAALAVVTLGAVYYANLNRGVPTVTLVLGFFLVFWSLVASDTRFGRHVYAVGGNPEAARRAGINVDRVKIAVFMIAGFMSGAGGIILASRLRSVATNTGGGNLLLNVIAAAVIGGTSLFGGKGRVVSALLGALVIASVENGMDLLGLASGTKFVITGLVLLAAVLVDALSKKSRTAAGTA